MRGALLITSVLLIACVDDSNTRALKYRDTLAMVGDCYDSVAISHPKLRRPVTHVTIQVTVGRTAEVSTEDSQK